MEKPIKTALVGMGAATAAMAALTGGVYALSSLLLHLALDRQMPPLMEKNRAKLTGESPDYLTLMAQVYESATQLQACGCVAVELTARDGTPLVGHWYEHPEPKRIVIAMHGWRSRWDQDFGLIAPFLHKNGCSVLYAEQRGQNASGGTHMTFGLLERYDCIDWVNWALSHSKQNLPVYLAGISMGATTVLMAGGLDLPNCVRGIVADCGFTTPHAIWRHVAERNLHLNYDLHQNWVNRLCRKRIHMGAEDASTLEAMANCKVPVLLVHGSDDSFVPVEMTYENYKACAAPKKLLIVPGAAHGLSYLTEPTQYQQAVKDFWQENDPA